MITCLLGLHEARDKMVIKNRRLAKGHPPAVKATWVMNLAAIFLSHLVTRNLTCETWREFGNSGVCAAEKANVILVQSSAARG